MTETEDTSPPAVPSPVRVDEDGIPLDRAPVLDDVRGNDGSHRRLAFGCTAAVALALIAFWLVRVVFM